MQSYTCPRDLSVVGEALIFDSQGLPVQLKDERTVGRDSSGKRCLKDSEKGIMHHKRMSTLAVYETI